MPGSQHTGGILICEDDITLLRIFRFILKKAGVEPVHTCSRGGDALAIALREKPVLALLDLMLPDKDGLAVLKDLKSNADTREIPVIVISAMESQRQVHAALQAGAVDYVIKPFNPQELGERLRQMMDALNGESPGAVSQAGA